MKKTICLLMGLFISISMSGCAQNNNEKSGEPSAGSTTEAIESNANAPTGEVGGYTDDREITAEELSIFEQVTKDLVGVGYKPKSVATQVVAGTNYRFTATATPTTPDAEAYDVYVFIFQPLDGSPELGEIVKLES